MKLAWLANKRPGLQLDASQLALVTDARFTKDVAAHVKKLNSAMQHTNNSQVHLFFPKLNLRSVSIARYSEAALANDHDLTSKPVCIILLVDDTKCAIPISFNSYKFQIVTRSVLPAELIAFADLFDDASALLDQLEQALRRGLAMDLLADSKSLFNIISKGSRTSEKQITVVIHATRQAYTMKQISTLRTVKQNQRCKDHFWNYLKLANVKFNASNGFTADH